MFSIVTPVWNKRHTIRRTVDAVFAQTFPEFELILVDDGSTDGSMEAVADISDHRLRRLRQVNRGPGPARNAGMATARHDWIAFLDADDLWFPFHLEELDRVRSRHPDAGLIGTSYVHSDLKGQFSLPATGAATIEEVPYFDCIVSGELTFCASCTAIPQAVVRSIGGFGDSLSGQDTEYWARIALEWPAARSTRVTSVYVHGTGGICDTAGTRWKGKELNRLEQLSPSVALVLRRRETVSSPEMARAIDRFIDKQIDWCLRGSIVHDDLATLRALRPIYPRRPGFEHFLLLAIARLPPSIARAIYRSGPRFKALLRRLGFQPASSPARRMAEKAQRAEGGKKLR